MKKSNKASRKTKFKYYLILLSSMEKVENVSIKLEGRFVRDIERAMKKHRFMTKTEFIRESIRDKINELEKQEMLKAVDKLFGSSRRKTTDEELHKAREKLADLYEKKYGFK